MLFGLLMVFLFSFMIQEQLKPFKMEPLFGRFEEVIMPKFHLETYQNGYFQKATEKYVSRNFGFREPIIRFYNQYCWDFYRKVLVNHTCSGKENWLYYKHNVDDHYGTEMYHWYPDAEAARQGYEQEVRLLNKIRGILQEYDVTVLTFIAPSKEVIYPEYLPRSKYDTTTLNARKYFMQRFEETGMPCFDMNNYFLQLKDTCSFFLFPPIGDHWNFSCVYAADTLLRFMERQRNDRLVHIEYGNEYTTECRIGEDKNRDLEGGLNLMRSIRFDPKFGYKERNYKMVSDSTTDKPSALFVGNSFLQRTIAYIPPKEVFSDFQFWYYNRVAYQGLDQIPDSVIFLNRLDYLLDAEYIVWFSSTSQMYRATEGFAEDAIIQLCIGDEGFTKRLNELKNSEPYKNTSRKDLAAMMRKNPEAFFPEIAGEGIPEARNPILLTDDCWKRRDIRRQIKHDPQWMAAVTTLMGDGLTLQQAIDRETDNVLLHKPTLHDADINPESYKNSLVKQMEQKIWHRDEWLEALKKTANEKGIPLEQFVHDNAVYMVNQKIKEGKVVLPKKE